MDARDSELKRSGVVLSVRLLEPHWETSLEYSAPGVLVFRDRLRVAEDQQPLTVRLVVDSELTHSQEAGAGRSG